MHTGVSSSWVVSQVCLERYTRVLMDASPEFPSHFLKSYSTRPPRQERRLSLDELGCCAGARQRPVVADPPWCWQLPAPAPGAGTTHDQRHCAAIWTRGPACLVEADHQGGIVRRRGMFGIRVKTGHSGVWQP